MFSDNEHQDIMNKKSPTIIMSDLSHSESIVSSNLSFDFLPGEDSAVL